MKWEVPEGGSSSTLLLAQNFQASVALPPKTEDGLNRRAQRKQRINGLPRSSRKAGSDCYPAFACRENFKLRFLCFLCFLLFDFIAEFRFAQRLNRSSNANGLFIELVILRDSQIINRKSSINSVGFLEPARHEPKHLVFRGQDAFDDGFSSCASDGAPL